MQDLINRFIKYAKVHTTSSEYSESVPTTEIQKDLFILILFVVVLSIMNVVCLKKYRRI